MADPKTWFLILSLVHPSPGDLPARLGPLTEAECFDQKARFQFPEVVTAECRHTCVMTVCTDPTNPGRGYSCPVFDETPTTGVCQ